MRKGDLPVLVKRKGEKKANEHKQCILSTRIIVGTEEECIKLTRMHEQKSKSSAFESKIEEKLQKKISLIP